MTYALFLDDERHPPNDARDWVVARTVAQAQSVIAARGWPDHISFDHDLGDGEPTGHDFAKWLVDAHLSGGGIAPFAWSYFVHSQNPVGKANIEGHLEAYLRFLAVPPARSAGPSALR